MKILLIGFFAFSTWSSLSTYIYVCMIKGLCNEPKSMQIGGVKPIDIITGDTTHITFVREQVIIPENRIIYFAFDKFEFNSDTETDKYFDESNKFMDQNSKAILSITGHADAIGSIEYNQSLGYRRAQSIQHYFVSKGIHTNKIIIESKGEEEPADNNNTRVGRANNRRIEITIKK